MITHGREVIKGDKSWKGGVRDGNSWQGGDRGW